jgi:hypothetical protein
LISAGVWYKWAIFDHVRCRQDTLYISPG